MFEKIKIQNKPFICQRRNNFKNIYVLEKFKILQAAEETHAASNTRYKENLALRQNALCGGFLLPVRPMADIKGKNLVFDEILQK